MRTGFYHAMNFLQTILAFLCALVPLIIFHELGHYTVARLCGVKVLRFSVGMGKVIWSRKFGPDQTEWVVSALPLGGYVKMLDGRDQDISGLSEQDRAREFTRQGVWRRIAIVAAGPAANFLLAILLFAGLFMVGVEDTSTRIRFMPENTPAWQAGLRGGDVINAVNGVPTTVWTDLRWEVMQAVLDKADLKLEVSRPERGTQYMTLPAAAMAGLSVESDVMGKLGITMSRPRAVLGQVEANGPAAQAGLQAGDTVLTINGKPVPDILVVRDMVRASGGKTLEFGLLRDGRELVLPLVPLYDPVSKSYQARLIFAKVADTISVSTPLFPSLLKGVRKTWESAVLQVKMIGKMIVGEISWKNVTGPITIADYAGQTARLGPTVFLSFIAAISIGLGVMNLLPIPVLDGGLLLYYSLEVLTGRPLPERVGEFAQRLGVGLLVMLMAIAVFNDVVRLL
jgi:regulator of sigma E protease